MKVAFISRSTLYTAPGGDTKQLDMTAHCLRVLGIEVDVYLSNKDINYSKYDLLHFFNIIRPSDIIKHIDRSGKPYVVSTIFVDYGKAQKDVGMVQRMLKRVFSDDGVEYIKALARAIKNGEKIVSKKYLRIGHRAAVRYVANNALLLLPNSQNEYNRFSNKYHLSRPYHVVPNGINTESALKEYPYSEKYDGAVICMGRIEPIKNQLSLVRALNDTRYKVFIHGNPSPNNIGYYEQCKAEASNNITIGEHLDEAALFTAYSNAKVHVLPSHFETTGLSSLEAAVMGCNIVVTGGGDTKDYFSGFAWFCNANDTQSIKDAVDAAYNTPYDAAVRERILKNYTWMRAAEETLVGYQQVLPH